MKKLVYTRVEYRDGEAGEIVKQSIIRVEKEPAMPLSVEPLGDGAWRRVSNGLRLEIVESWRLLDAARMVA